MNMADGSETNSDDAKRDQRLEAVIADYIRDCEAGRSPDQWEILAAHPELAADLQEFFANRNRLNQIAAPIVTPEATDDESLRKKYENRLQVIQAKPAE